MLRRYMWRPLRHKNTGSETLIILHLQARHERGSSISAGSRADFSTYNSSVAAPRVDIVYLLMENIPHWVAEHETLHTSQNWCKVCSVCSQCSSVQSKAPLLTTSSPSEPGAWLVSLILLTRMIVWVSCRPAAVPRPWRQKNDADQRSRNRRRATLLRTDTKGHTLL
jgi:hypothetical protein